MGGKALASDSNQITVNEIHIRINREITVLEHERPRVIQRFFFREDVIPAWRVIIPHHCCRL